MRDSRTYIYATLQYNDIGTINHCEILFASLFFSVWEELIVIGTCATIAMITHSIKFALSFWIIFFKKKFFSLLPFNNTFHSKFNYFIFSLYSSLYIFYISFFCVSYIKFIFTLFIFYLSPYFLIFFDSHR